MKLRHLRRLEFFMRILVFEDKSTNHTNIEPIPIESYHVYEEKFKITLNNDTNHIARKNGLTTVTPIEFPQLDVPMKTTY